MSIDNETKRKMVENYVAAYNRFDVENMLNDLDERVTFRNVSNGAVNLTTDGIDEFRRQAEIAAALFSRREQKITDLKFGEAHAEAAIEYRGTLAADLPNGLKKGDEIKLNGKSIFRFEHAKIVEIEDVG